MPYGARAAIGRNITAIRLKEEFVDIKSFLITLLTSKWMKNEIEMNKDVGTILDALNVKAIPELKFFYPGKNKLFEFEKILNPIREKIEENISQIQSLTKTRDTLLPKLMSGQVRVNNIKQTVDA
jgi:type I restriction enzyme S subunit